MSDAEPTRSDPLAEPDFKRAKVYPDGPWAVKFVAGPYKQMAIEAAERAKLPVGEWLARAITREVEAERESQPGHGPRYDILAPGQHGAVRIMDAGPPLSLEELASAIEITARLRELTAADKLTEREANDLRRKLRQRIGLPPARQQRARAADGAKRLTNGPT